MPEIQFIRGKLDFSFIKLRSLSWDLYFLELNFVVLEQTGYLNRCYCVAKNQRLPYIVTWYPGGNSCGVEHRDAEPSGVIPHQQRSHALRPGPECFLLTAQEPLYLWTCLLPARGSSKGERTLTGRGVRWLRPAAGTEAASLHEHRTAPEVHERLLQKLKLPGRFVGMDTNVGP